MKKVLVTGAAGFVGGNLVRRLLADGDEVVAVIRPGSDLWRLDDLGGDLEFATLDLRDDEAVRRVLGDACPEWIFHLAAHGAYSFQRDPSRILETNVLGTANLLDAALTQGFEAFVNCGSSSEYGHKDHGPSESEALEPNSAYAVGKAAASMYCRHRAIEVDAHVVTLRLYSAYGPWEEPSRLIPRLIVRGFEGELPPLADPRVARDFVYVADVVAACLCAARADGLSRGSIYNVGTGKQTSLEEAVEAVRSELALKVEPTWGSMPNRTWDTTTWVAEIGAIKRDLGWRPRFDFPDGIQATIDWLRDGPALRAFYSEPR